MGKPCVLVFRGCGWREAKLNSTHIGYDCHSLKFYDFDLYRIEPKSVRNVGGLAQAFNLTMKNSRGREAGEK